MDISKLKRLLPLLVANGVSSYKQGSLEIYFKDSSDKPSYELISNDVKPKDDAPVSPEPLNPDPFKADELMNFDQVLNWSGSPKEDEVPIPLTADVPLTPEAP